MEGDDVFRNGWNASFVLVGVALTFLPIERQIVVKVMLARKQNKGLMRWGITAVYCFHSTVNAHIAMCKNHQCGHVTSV